MSHPLEQAVPARRYRRRSSPITQPGYGKGKPHPMKGRKYPPEPLTREEMLAALRACSNRGKCGVRDRALYAVLWRTGLRISEALALELRDVNLDDGFLRVRHGKGDKDRVVAIDPDAAAVLERWLELRKKIGIPRGAPVFCTISQPTPGGPLGQPQVRDKMRKIEKRIGLEKRFRPHQLRHTHAVEMAMENVPLPVISAQLGHANAAITHRYINHVAPAQRLALLHARPGFEL